MRTMEMGCDGRETANETDMVIQGRELKIMSRMIVPRMQELFSSPVWIFSSSVKDNLPAQSCFETFDDETHCATNRSSWKPHLALQLLPFFSFIPNIQTPS